MPFVEDANAEGFDGRQAHHEAQPAHARHLPRKARRLNPPPADIPSREAYDGHSGPGTHRLTPAMFPCCNLSRHCTRRAMRSPRCIAEVHLPPKIVINR